MGNGVQHDLVHEYRRQAHGLLARLGQEVEVDFARLDGMIAADMAKGGRFTPGRHRAGIPGGVASGLHFDTDL